MGQIKNIKLHIVTDIKWFDQSSWADDQPDVTDTARTSPTLSPVSAVVCQTRRSESSISVRRRLVWMSSLSVSTWCPMSTNSCLLTGMRGAYGKPQGTVARVNIGQPLMSIRCKDAHEATA